MALQELQPEYIDALIPHPSDEDQSLHVTRKGAAPEPGRQLAKDQDPVDSVVS